MATDADADADADADDDDDDDDDDDHHHVTPGVPHSRIYDTVKMVHKVAQGIVDLHTYYTG